MITPAVLGTVSRACRECLQLHVRYRDAHGHETERRVEPLGIVSAGRRWYLVRGTSAEAIGGRSASTGSSRRARPAMASLVWTRPTP